MPPGYEPLLAAVCAAPWDDLPRLVFADFLDDHGEADRAEFIRLQCETVGVRKRDPRCRRVAELLRANAERWRAELPQLPNVIWGGFRRGFVGEARVLDRMTLFRRLVELVAASPVQSLEVGSDAHGFRMLAASPRLAGLSRLEVPHWYGVGWDDEAVVRLASNPAAGRLRTLRLVGRQHTSMWPVYSQAQLLTDRSAVALAGSVCLCRLCTVRLDGTDFSSAALAALQRRFGSGLTVIG